MDHLHQPWFKKCQEASASGKIYAFGIRAIKEEQKQFYAEGRHQLEKFSFRYEPNPFVKQYDLLIHIWINYYKILKREIQLLKDKPEVAQELKLTNTIYGIERKEFWFAAAELRWPTFLKNGAYRGIFVRDPWADSRISALSDETHKYIMTFGGGGQGKTVVFCAFLVTMFDHYIFTEKGARCMFSTTSKDKINSASWPNIQRFINNTEKDISLYAGKGVIAGDFTIKRPGTKDTAGVMKGILISNQKNDNATDKLTGSHGHPFIGYLIDEIQATPLAPINASSNFTLHCGDHRIMGAGNYNEDTDSLGLNVVPNQGWDNVDQNTHKWYSVTTNKNPAIVLHFSNENSPGMDSVLSKKFPHLPSEKTLREKFAHASSRDILNKQYRRFWLGWRLENADGDTILTSSMIRDNNAGDPLELDQITHNFLSFDSAQAEGDRNLLGHFREGKCSHTGERVWGIYNIIEKIKSSESLKYYTDSTDEIMRYMQKQGIKTRRGMILDWTGRPAHAEILLKKGIETVQLTYNAAIPDGKRIDSQTKKVLKPILVFEGYDEQGNVFPKNRIYAHMIAQNRISFGAWLLQEYVKSGRVRGINKKMMEWITSANHPLEEEMFTRKFRTKNSQQYGELVELVPKKEFKELYGYSPDLLDLWFQAAYYMFMERQLPITPIGGADQNRAFQEDDHSVTQEDYNNLWKSDQINDDGHTGIHSGFGWSQEEIYW